MRRTPIFIVLVTLLLSIATYFWSVDRILLQSGVPTLSLGRRISQVVNPNLQVQPNHGPASGGNVVTISGVFFGTTQDISRVTLAGVPATILSQNSVQVVVRAGQGEPGTLGNVVVESQSQGQIIAIDAYSYEGAGNSQHRCAAGAHVVDGAGVGGSSPIRIRPVAGPLSGGNVVSIRGLRLDAGDRVLNVSLAGVAARLLPSADRSVVLVIAGPSLNQTRSGPVAIFTALRGGLVADDSYSYIGSAECLRAVVMFAADEMCICY